MCKVVLCTKNPQKSVIYNTKNTNIKLDQIHCLISQRQVPPILLSFNVIASF